MTGLAFGLTDLALAAVFGARRLAVAAASTLLMAPVALAGGRALRNGRVSLAIACAWASPLAAATIASLLVPEIELIPTVAIVVVLVLLPLVEERVLMASFVGVLAWAVALATVRDFVPRTDALPPWYVHTLRVAALASSTALAMFLLRNFHRRLIASFARPGRPRRGTGPWSSSFRP